MAKSKNKSIVANKKGRRNDGTFKKGTKLAGQKKWEKYSKISEMVDKVYSHGLEIMVAEVDGKLVEKTRLDLVLEALYEKATVDKDVHAIKEYLIRTVGPVRKVITVDKEENTPIAILSNIVDVTEIKDAVSSNNSDKKDKQAKEKD